MYQKNSEDKRSSKLKKICFLCLGDQGQRTLAWIEAF